MILYFKSQQKILFSGKSWECRSDFFPGHNSQGQPRESLPCGDYTCSAEIGDFGPAFGCFYIETGDSRERDIHGGGSDLDDPFAAFQGWLPTYGCLRMQNADGVALAKMIIDAGNSVAMKVMD